MKNQGIEPVLTRESLEIAHKNAAPTWPPKLNVAGKLGNHLMNQRIKCPACNQDSLRLFSQDVINEKSHLYCANDQCNPAPVYPLFDYRT
jgi:hypothetical protein